MTSFNLNDLPKGLISKVTLGSRASMQWIWGRQNSVRNKGWGEKHFHFICLNCGGFVQPYGGAVRSVHIIWPRYCLTCSLCPCRLWHKLCILTGYFFGLLLLTNNWAQAYWYFKSGSASSMAWWLGQVTCNAQDRWPFSGVCFSKFPEASCFQWASHYDGHKFTMRKM